MGKSRVCWRCHAQGIMIHFLTRKEYKVHVKTRHESKPRVLRVPKKEVKRYRKQVLIFRQRNGIAKL